jgi:hypothetical protein
MAGTSTKVDGRWDNRPTARSLTVGRLVVKTCEDARYRRPASAWPDGAARAGKWGPEGGEGVDDNLAIAAWTTTQPPKAAPVARARASKAARSPPSLRSRDVARTRSAAR